VSVAFSAVYDHVSHVKPPKRRTSAPAVTTMASLSAPAQTKMGFDGAASIAFARVA
jgi:hypothetical protein